MQNFLWSHSFYVYFRSRNYLHSPTSFHFYSFKNFNFWINWSFFWMNSFVPTFLWLPMSICIWCFHFLVQLSRHFWYNKSSQKSLPSILNYVSFLGSISAYNCNLIYRSSKSGLKILVKKFSDSQNCLSTYNVVNKWLEFYRFRAITNTSNKFLNAGWAIILEKLVECIQSYKAKVSRLGFCFCCEFSAWNSFNWRKGPMIRYLPFIYLFTFFLSFFSTQIVCLTISTLDFEKLKLLHSHCSGFETNKALKISIS